jgi:hypothetical protein
MDRCLETQIWKGASDQGLEEAREGMEKLVMMKLYPLTFTPTSSDDAQKDDVLRRKMLLFSWIKEVRSLMLVSNVIYGVIIIIINYYYCCY